MKKQTKFIISVIMDLFGWLGSMLFTGFSDIIFAPIQSVWILYAYQSTPMAIIGFSEEILPLTDFIPTCSIAHILTKGGSK